MSQAFGKYIIEKELGRGAAGIVYLARDPDLDRQVAIKVLVVPHTFGESDRAKLFERFRREARAAAGLEAPSIPHIYEVGEISGDHYIAMEYCQGSTLALRLAEEGPLQAEEARRVMLGVLDALQVAHARGIVHRDVKTGNIMLGPGGSVKLMDFGIASIESDTALTQTGVLTGTPAYMAPEQVTGGPVGPATDLYAAGLVLHEMLTGEKPFPQQSVPQVLHAIVYEEPRLSSGLPSEFLPVIKRCLCKDPADRFQSAAEMAAALRDAKSSGRISQGLSECSLIPSGTADRPARLWVGADDPTIQGIRKPDPSPGEPEKTPRPDWFGLFARRSHAGLVALRAGLPLLSRNGETGSARDTLLGSPIAGLSVGAGPLERKPDLNLPSNPGISRLPTQELSGATLTNPTDGAEMVYVPPGEFLMGNAIQDTNPRRTRNWPGDQTQIRGAFQGANPGCKVTLDAFWVYKNDVTVAQYRKYCDATGKEMPPAPGWGWKDDHPVVNVTWDEAKAYCDWAGVALPTEAQWEKAARGTDGRKYPWGKGWDPRKLQCSKKNGGDAVSTAPVGSFPAGASPYGCLDMAGNVWQWCADWYQEAYLKNGPATNPTGPLSGECRVLRGGSWLSGAGPYFQSACRYYNDPTDRYTKNGFRAVWVVDVASGSAPAPQAAPILTPLRATPTAAASKPHAGKAPINPIDRAEIVFVPAGPFLMGDIDLKHNPCRTIWLDGYWIYKMPVTVAQYRKFCQETGKQMPQAPDWGWKEDHPVVSVTWHDAKAYCVWAGTSLPTEAQWEKAARGTLGKEYPWGNKWDARKLWCSVGTMRMSTAPVGSYPAGASPYRCLDMAGNVLQWCEDWYDENYPKSTSPTNPIGPAAGLGRVLRGGSWEGNIEDFFRCAIRDYGNTGDGDDISGFRCVVREEC